MLNRPEPAAPLDALILVPPGSLSDFAEDLGAELVRLGLNMKVRSVRSNAECPLKAAVSEDADTTRASTPSGTGRSVSHTSAPAIPRRVVSSSGQNGQKILKSDNAVTLSAPAMRRPVKSSVCPI